MNYFNDLAYFSAAEGPGGKRKTGNIAAEPIAKSDAAVLSRRKGGGSPKCWGWVLGTLQPQMLGLCSAIPNAGAVCALGIRDLAIPNAGVVPWGLCNPKC